MHNNWYTWNHEHASMASSGATGTSGVNCLLTFPPLLLCIDPSIQLIKLDNTLKLSEASEVVQTGAINKTWLGGAV